jgi:hypothetical protein
MVARILVMTALLVCAPLPGWADDGCSHDSFNIDGTQVAAILCAPAQAKPAGAVSVNATFSTKTANFNKSISLDVLPGQPQSRGIEEVSLAPLGLAHSLYMTVTYGAGKVTLAHAVLLPGAVILK